MPLHYWRRETVAYERLRRVEGDRWRSADAERKMRSSEKYVHVYIFSYKCAKELCVRIRVCLFVSLTLCHR